MLPTFHLFLPWFSPFIELISSIVSSIWCWYPDTTICVVWWYRGRVIQWYWYSFLHRCFYIDTLRYVSLLPGKFPCCHAIPCVLRNGRAPTPRPCQPPTMAAAPLTLARPSRQWFLRESRDHLEWQRWVLRLWYCIYTCHWPTLNVTLTHSSATAHYKVRRVVRLTWIDPASWIRLLLHLICTHLPPTCSEYVY